MPSILIIEKPGTIRELKVKVFSESELYKKAGFKSPEGFKSHANWNVDLNGDKYSITLYGKVGGKAMQENKYDFPPPADNKLFFGNCVLTNTQNGEISDLTQSKWEKIYEHLFGGFEDIGKEDSDDNESESDDANIPKTKNGYVKDGFVVDDDEPSECESPKRKKRNVKSSKIVPDIVTEDEPENCILDCTSELSEEEYLE
jgi:hypothetical protein